MTDLFDIPVTRTVASTPRIICAVCRSLTTRSHIHGAKLCDGCSTQPERTRAHVCSVRDAAQGLINDANPAIAHASRAQLQWAHTALGELQALEEQR